MNKTTWLLAMARTGPAVWVGLATRAPRWVRLLLVLCMAALVAPTVAAVAAVQATLRGPTLLKEVLVGLALGLTVAVPFAAAEAAGALVDRSCRDRDHDHGSFALFNSLLTLALFGALRGPELTTLALARSYTLLPIGAETAPNGGELVGLELGARLITLALSLAAPFLAALLIGQLLGAFVARLEPLSGELIGGASLRTLSGVALFTLWMLPLVKKLVVAQEGLGSLPQTIQHTLMRLLPP